MRDKNDGVGQFLKWYFCSSVSKYIRFWDAIIGINFILGSVYICLHFGFSNVYDIFYESEFERAFIVIEVLWIFEFFLNFVRVPYNMKRPSLKKTSGRYIKSMFLFDFTASIISNALLVFDTSTEIKLFAFKLKLLRIFKIGYVRKSVDYFAAIVRRVKSNNNFIHTLISLTLY